MRTRLVAPSLAIALTASLPAMAAVNERAFIDQFLSIPSAVTTIVGTVLPERSHAGASYLSETYDPNLMISARSNVFVTFIHEGATYRNSLGYFTFTSDGGSIVILDRQLVFPNASYADPNKGWGGGTLATGDTVTLRDAAGAPRVFEPGTRIGFFLVSNGWSSGSVSGWDELNPALPSADPATNARGNVMTTIDGLNPEISTGFTSMARHVALLRVRGIPGFIDGNDFLLLGMEDQRRDISSDHDFNDMVMLVRSNPVGAILDDTPVPIYDPSNNDPDGDGVQGLNDHFPEDPERAFVIRTPPSGWASMTFEDLYPNVGDGDFNDAVIEMAFEEVLRADGRLKDVSGTFHLIARGASLDHRFGVALHHLPAVVQGSVLFERFTSTGVHQTASSGTLDEFLYTDVDGALSARIHSVFPSTAAAMIGVDGPFTNTVDPSTLTPPASARFVVTFASPIDRGPLGAPPYDPFLQVRRGERDIHLPGFHGFPDRAADLPEESGRESFTDDNGYPFAFLVPKNWRYPLEHIRIDGAQGAYPAFSIFRTTKGAQATNWYASPYVGATSRVVDAISETLRSRPWGISVTKLDAAP